jgi:uncharacterized protein (DUF433 family)
MEVARDDAGGTVEAGRQGERFGAETRKGGAMHLSGYFEILDADDIRIRGTRVGIETVLEDYLDGLSPEEIAARYRALTLEQVYATITYYFSHKQEVDAYLERWRAYAEAQWQAQRRRPPSAVRRLQALKARREAQAEPVP